MVLTLGESSSSSSPYSSNSTPRLSTYHVFLSFRGEDTRKGFTDHLYAALERKGITTFRDDKYLERGQVISKELLKAIEESMFAITILSQDYASSTWCLDELQKIMESNNNRDLKVFPVFYGVDPSDVRHQRGSYEEAFRKHQDKFGQQSDKVEKWRDALTQVASHSGWDSKDQHEAELVESIAQRIHEKLVPKLPSCTESLVGIASRVEEVNKLIGMGLNDIRFIGIWGMGGLGKTTIARAVYEAIQCEFQVTCFLANVREVSETNGLVHLQRELLSHLSKSKKDFHNLYDGKKIILNSLCRKKVLLVLDDVNELKQLENLAGKQEWFGPGSRVIITTRDMHMLITHGIHEPYEVEKLFPNEALNLFCLKAFKGNQPQEGYFDLSQEVVDYCDGLPLALEVLGSYLYGRNIDVWHSAVKKLTSVPHREIMDKMMISYEGLDSMEKNIFLDIACFFKGRGRDAVIDILKYCGYIPEIGIEILVERSLITLDPESDILGMHDLLQQMGRDIVFQESPNYPGRRSRLWSEEDIDFVLTNNKGTQEIKSLCLNLMPLAKLSLGGRDVYEAGSITEAFSNMSQLKILCLNGTALPLCLSCLPSSLKVLHWRGCPLKTLQLSNQLNEVVDIDLSESKIVRLWLGKQFMEKLKCLNLSYCYSLKRLPDLSGIPNLEKVIIEECINLIEVHPSLVHLKKVVLMDFKNCRSLESLPGKLEMSSLKKLILSGCSRFKFLPEFEEGMELAVLNLEDCESLVCLPETIHELNSLKILNISGCSKLSRLPDGLKELKCLEELNTNDTAIDELPSYIFHLNNMKVLSFSGCRGPLTNPKDWLSLYISNFYSPTGFRFPPSVWSLPSLKFLYLSKCNLSEESVPDYFCQLPSLLLLDLSGNNFVSIPSNISELPMLEILVLNGCQKLKLLPELPSSIKELDASNCDSLETSNFSPAKLCSIFPSLEQLSMEGHCVHTARFDMVIPGTEIPSWFVPQTTVFRAKIQVPNNCPIDEWIGVALCSILENNSLYDSNGEINCYLFTPNGKKLVSTRRLPTLFPSSSHLYIMYLSIDELRGKICEDDCWIEFGWEILDEHDNHFLEIVRCGSRLVCKKDAEDWNKVVRPFKKSKR